MPNPQEIAEIRVNGQSFKDWETVFVQQRMFEPFHWFRFTAAERDPVPEAEFREKLQLKEGDPCEIFLAGFQMIRGMIMKRQVAYDADNHGVMLVGMSDTHWPSKSSVDNPGGNFDGMTFEQVAKKVLAVYGHTPVVLGKLDPTPFEKLQCEPGENVWDFLEKIARPRGIIMGSNHEGQFLLIGDHELPTGGDLTEGFNIKRCQCVFDITPIFEIYDARGQSSGGDDQHGADSNEQHAEADGTAPKKSKLITPAEQPVKSIYELAMRAKNEAKWHEQAIIECVITVQGWLRAGGAPWRYGDMAFVDSPMAMLNRGLGIMSATFTQDSRTGTLTTLELVKPELMNGYGIDVRKPR